MPAKYMVRVRLRPEARTAATMLAAIHRKGEDSPYRKGLEFWVGDVVDTVTCIAFKETFGISVSEYLQRVRARIRGKRRFKYVPTRSSLERAASRLLAHANELAGHPGGLPQDGSPLK